MSMQRSKVRMALLTIIYLPERRQPMTGLEELRSKNPCFGGHKDNMGRIHLPVSPACNIGCRFCDRVRNDYEDRPGITSKVITPEESLDIIG